MADEPYKPKKEQILFVGDQSLPPLSYLKYDNPAGLLVDLVFVLTERMQNNAQIKLTDRTEAYELVLNGQARALLQHNINFNNADTLRFSDPLLISEFSVFSTVKIPYINTIQDLQGLTVGLEERGIPMLLVQEYPQITVKIIPGPGDAFEMLTTGEVDVVLVDRWTAGYILPKHNIRSVKLIEKNIKAAHSAIGVKQENAELLKKINTALAEIRRDGTYDAVVNHWRFEETTFKVHQEVRQQAWLIILILMIPFIILCWLFVLEREIVRRRRAEAGLQQSQRLLARSQEIAHVGTWILHLSTRRLTWSDEVYRIFNLDPEEFTVSYEAFLNVIHPDDRAAVDEGYSVSLKEGRESYEIEHRIIRKNTGEIRFVHNKCIHERDNDGTIFQSAGIIQDITERKLAEENEKKLAIAAEAAASSSWVLDVKSGRLWFGPRDMGLFNLNSSEPMTIERYINMMHSDDRAAVREGIDHALTSGKMEIFEYRITRPDGSIRWLQSRGRLSQSDRKDIIWLTGITSDITERKQAEIQEKERQEHMAQAAKMAALGTLVAGVAHEINNPNNFIMLNAPLLEQVWNDSLPVLDSYYENNPDFETGDIPFNIMRENAAKLFSGIHRGSKRIKRIVSELKNFSRQTPSDMSKAIDINQVVERSLTMMEKTIAQHTDNFIMKLEPDLPLICGDFQKLEQVFINLLINACQALPDKDSKIIVETLSDTPENDVILRITDEGEGISDENMSRICDPFFSTRHDIGGTGLGLAVSSSIIRMHEARMVFDSKPGSGTTVTIHFRLRSVQENSGMYETDKKNNPL